jgi:hypothetical protein
MDNELAGVIQVIVKQQWQDRVDQLSGIQNRAATMSAVTATIMGIGVPLIAAVGAARYFHTMPFILLICSFILFYTAFIRNSPATFKVTGIKGVPEVKQYKMTKLEKLLRWNIRLPKDKPTEAADQLDKQITWGTLTMKWAHSFFLSCIALEIVEVTMNNVYPHSENKARFYHLLTALFFLALFRWVFLRDTVYTNTGTIKVR